MDVLEIQISRSIDAKHNINITVYKNGKILTSIDCYRHKYDVDFDIHRFIGDIYNNLQGEVFVIKDDDHIIQPGLGETFNVLETHILDKLCIWLDDNPQNQIIYDDIPF